MSEDKELKSEKKEPKKNSDSVSEYHKQIKDMKIRFPRENQEKGIPDYSETIKRQASLFDKSVNEYVLDLIENDIKNNPDGLNDSDFFILRDMKAINKLKDK